MCQLWWEKIASLDEDRPDLSDTEDALDKVLFKLSLQIKWLLNNTPSNVRCTSNASGVKLPRIDVPTFDGNIVNWSYFGSSSKLQSTVSVNFRTLIS